MKHKTREATRFGRPLDGVRILAIEQMQALPYGTQLLSRLGADVVKVEPLTGESARGALPSMLDPQGQPVGSTFLRNNLGKEASVLTSSIRRAALSYYASLLISMSFARTSKRGRWTGWA